MKYLRVASLASRLTCGSNTRFKLTIEDHLWSRLVSELTGFFKPAVTSQLCNHFAACLPPLPGEHSCRGTGRVEERKQCDPALCMNGISQKRIRERKTKDVNGINFAPSRFLSKTTFQMSGRLRWLKPTKLATPKPTLCLSRPTAHYLLSPGVCTSSMRSLKSARWAWLSQYCQQRWPAPPSRSASREANSRG